MRICLLASGSKANSLFVESGQTRLLIDAGLSAREIRKRLELVGVDAESLTALLITHEHRDHLDLKAVEAVRTDKTVLVLTETCAAGLKGGIIMENGDTKTVGGLKIEAVPAYNLVHMRSAGVPFHSKGIGNGYVITFGDKRVYVAGDTENIPEMKKLENIDCAFLPMNLPYTMTPEMVADAAKAFKPKILYPYHYGDTDTSNIEQLMKDTQDVEIRIRMMK